MAEEEPRFQKASVYKPDDITLMQVNFQSFFQWTLDLAKENQPEGYALNVKASNPLFSAEITYTPPPPARYTRGQTSQPTKKATLSEIQAICSEDQGSLEITETDTEIRIRPTAFLSDRWRPIMQKLNEFKDAKWNKVEGKNTSYWSVPK